MATLMMNPRKKTTKRKATRKRAVARVTRKAPVARKRRPVARRSKDIVKSTIMPAAVSGAGAIGLDIVYGKLPIPAALKTGPFKYLVKGAAAIGLGMVAGKVVNKQMAEQLSSGALTVVMHQAMSEGVGKFAPGLTLSAYEVDEDAELLSAYLDGDESMGAYMDNDLSSAGYTVNGVEDEEEDFDL